MTLGPANPKRVQTNQASPHSHTALSLVSLTGGTNSEPFPCGASWQRPLRFPSPRTLTSSSQASYLTTKLAAQHSRTEDARLHSPLVAAPFRAARVRPRVPTASAAPRRLVTPRHSAVPVLTVHRHCALSRPQFGNATYHPCGEPETRTMPRHDRWDRPGG